MKKKFLSTLMILCCSNAVAYTGNVEINSALESKQKIVNFVLDENCQSFSIIPGSHRTAMIVLYVNKYRPSKNGAVSADPVRVNCDGTPVIINPGSSFACYTPDNKHSVVEIEPGFFKNGAEGFAVSAE